MDKIYEYQDRVEEVKFLLSALKIQAAFVNMMRIADKKIANYQSTFIEQLQQYSTFSILRSGENIFNRIDEIQERAKQRVLRRTFYQLLLVPDKEEKLIDKVRRASAGKEEPFEGRMMAISVINEEDWKEKLTPQELDIHCRFYREKIEEVQKSFADFFQVIKKE